MKKFFLIAVLLLSASLYVGMRYAADSGRVLRVGVECNHEPYNWEEKASSNSNVPLVNNPGFYAEGYDVQMAIAIADEIGAKAEFYKIPFNDLIRALNDGEIDAIFSGMVDTDERKKVIRFSEPYQERSVEYAVLLNRKSKYAKAESIMELEGASMIAQKDSRFDSVIDQIPNVIHLEPIESQTAIIDEVINFKADGTVINYDTGQSYTNAHYRELMIIHFDEGKGFELGFTGLCAGFRKTDNMLLDDVNYALGKISQMQRQRIMDRTIHNLWKNQ